MSKHARVSCRLLGHSFPPVPEGFRICRVLLCTPSVEVPHSIEHDVHGVHSERTQSSSESIDQKLVKIE